MTVCGEEGRKASPLLTFYLRRLALAPHPIPVIQLNGQAGQAEEGGSVNDNGVAHVMACGWRRGVAAGGPKGSGWAAASQ